MPRRHWDLPQSAEEVGGETPLACGTAMAEDLVEGDAAEVSVVWARRVKVTTVDRGMK